MEKLEYVKTEGTTDSNSWSTFLNKNPTLVDAIVNYKHPTTFTLLNTEWTIAEYEEEEVKCTSGRNVQYFPKSDIDDILNDRKKAALSKMYNPISEMLTQFGTLYNVSGGSDGINEYLTVKTVILDDISFPEGSMWRANEMIRYRDFEYRDSTREISLKFSDYWQVCFVEYDNDGNFVCRDYNIKFKDYTQETAAFSDIIRKFNQAILNLGPLSVQGTSFYNKDFFFKAWLNCVWRDGQCSEFEITIEKIPVRSDGYSYQKYRGETIYKVPQQSVIVEPSEVLATIERLYLNRLKEFANL
jgi:hypothetical protein